LEGLKSRKQQQQKQQQQQNKSNVKNTGKKEALYVLERK
jgi:hypothetical protein